jgi:hypothetical protein
MFQKACINRWVKTRSIDGISYVGITLWSDKQDSFQLLKLPESNFGSEKIKRCGDYQEIGGSNLELK